MKKILLGATTAIILLTLACRKEFDKEEIPDENSIFLTEAKNNFYKETKNNAVAINSEGYFTNSASSVKNKPVITPLWRFSEISKSGGNTFIEIPIIVQKKQIALYNYLKEPESETINLSRLNFSFQRLLSYKTAKGKFNELILTYIPSYSYITSHGIDAPKLKINNIKEKQFTGYVEYRTITGVKLFTLLFKNGKFLQKFIDTKTSINGLKVSSNDIKANALNCRDVCIPLYSRICVELGDPPVEYCGDWEEYDRICSEVCTEVPDGPEEPIDPENPDPCSNPANFYLCNPDNPNDPPIDPPVAPKPDPCGEANKLEQNNSYKNEMLDLKSKTNLDREVGYSKTVGNNSVYKEGTPGTLGWDAPQPNDLANKSLERISHTHYDAPNSMAIFSGADVDAFSQYVGQGKAANLGFTLSVTTSQGLSYALVIEDVNKFNSFYAIYGSGTGITLLVSIFDGAASTTNTTPSQNENKFINFLSLLNTGIALLKSNNDFTEWNKRKKDDSTNNTINDPCN